MPRPDKPVVHGNGLLNQKIAEVEQIEHRDKAEDEGQVFDVLFDSLFEFVPGGHTNLLSVMRSFPTQKLFCSVPGIWGAPWPPVVRNPHFQLTISKLR